MKNLLSVLLVSGGIAVTGCAQVSLPTLPSLPWSSSTAKIDPSAEGLFQEGMRAFNEKKYVRAIDAFTKIKTDHPFSPLVNDAELKIADAHYLNEQYPEAVAAFKEFQALHPTSEHAAFVTYRLGQAHFDQFTAIDREQKHTEIAKDYFDAVITKYPKSPYAAEAKVKLAKVLEYLAEHEFSAAHFYFQQQKYAAARDRFEEIIRKYRDTPTAVKSLFFLGESYRNEKNSPRAALAYEALIQRYPQTKYAADAKVQLATLSKEKSDPLDLLLMRDRRPGGQAAPEVKEDPALARLKGVNNLVAKKDVVHEEPGTEKGFLQRVADKINPFAPSSTPKPETAPQSGLDLIAKKNSTEKESGGLVASLWPFGGKSSAENAKSTASNTGSSLVSKVDQSLKQKGIDDSKVRQTAATPPPSDPTLPQAPAQVAPSDTVALLGAIDSNLSKRGTNPQAAPTPPQAHAAFNDPEIAKALAANAAAKAEPQDVRSSGILSSIDQKLQSRGVEPGKFQPPPTPTGSQAAAAKAPPKAVELEPNLALGKGPMFLNPGEAQNRPGSTNPAPAAEPTDKSATAGTKPPDTTPRTLVKGPVQPAQQAAAPKAANPSAVQGEESKGVFDQMRQDLENASKLLNPFRW